MSPYFAGLDCSFIHLKLTSAHYELPYWPESLAKHCVELYRRFLWLHHQYPQEKLVPTRDIDECWHIHILNTKQYAQDCETLFGHYFHHQPADPANETEIENLQQQFERTQQLYLTEFGEELTVLQRQ